MNFLRGTAVALSLLAATVIASPLGDRSSLLASLGISDWAHPEGHPIHKLFARQANGTLAIGSKAWMDQYPDGDPTAATAPAAWLKIIKDAENAGLIPDIPLSSSPGSYPGNFNAVDKEVCSSSAQCEGDGDIWDAPDGLLGLSFDDGPTEVAPQLYDFLRQNNQRVTHFMIGANIRNNWESFMAAYQDGNDMAVHTWSHKPMTTLSNEAAFLQLAWTMQIISDMTGGRVPKYWRPPQGDSDNRIRAIGKLLGIVQVNWNRDTNDWELQTKKVTAATVSKNLNTWLKGPKSPGLIILEHELDALTVKAFIDIYPVMKSTGWNIQPISKMDGSSGYLNAAGNTGAVIPMSVGGSQPGNVPTAATNATASATGSGTAAGAATTASKSTTNTSASNSAISVLQGTSHGILAALVASVLSVQYLLS